MGELGFNPPAPAHFHINVMLIEGIANLLHWSTSSVFLTGAGSDEDRFAPGSKSLLKLSLSVEFHIFNMSAVKLLTSQNEFDFMLIKCEAAAAYKAAAF